MNRPDLDHLTDLARRDDWHTQIVGSDLRVLVAYARELEATLANEVGRGEPPVPGFVFIGNGGERSTWQREVGTVGAYVTREITNLGEIRWAWRIIEDRYGTDESPRFCTHASGAESTARAAMRAASVPA